MAKKRKKQSHKKIPVIEQSSNLTEHIPRSGLITGAAFTVIACIFTFPLIFKMNSSIYGFYDHVTTDLFATIHYYFWWMKEAVVTVKTSPLINPLIAAPYGSRMIFTNFTGYAQLPITILFGHLFSRNFAILFNLVASGLGAFYLVRYITKHDGAGIIAGIVYAFCPNMLVRSYTTFDSTQVQWIPFYTLFLIRFIEDKTWKHALLAGMFLLFNILFAMPYYLVYLPVQTIVVMLALAVWHAVGKKRGFNGLVKDLASPAGLKATGKAVSVLAVIAVIFAVYYSSIIGGETTMSTVQRTKAQLGELALKPLDYLVPHPRSALLKGDFKASYWDAVDRPEKNSDSNVAYIGYAALALAVYGFVKSKGSSRWVFLGCAVAAFWSTLGPTVLGLPSPSGLIHTFYAPFARRILMYKVFVQMSIAVLAGMGAAHLLRSIRKSKTELILAAGIALFMLLEYTLVPPTLSVDLTHNPEVYERVRDLPDDAAIFEVPFKRMNGNHYQGYMYYQTVHGKALFNHYMGLNFIPDRIKPFYVRMEVPLEAQEYSNLAALRYLGISHLVYHHAIRTMTVGFPAFMTTAFEEGNIDGLERIFKNEREPNKGIYPSPFDYTFADLYEITAEPCPVALTFDYHSPYEPVPGLLARDGYTQIGWQSALYDTTPTFYYPYPHLENFKKTVRMMRQGGKVTAVNLSDEPVDFSVSFFAESDDEGREIVVKWNDGPDIGNFVIGPEPVKCEIGPFHLDGAGTGEVTIWSTRDAFDYGPLTISTTAVLSDFRVVNIPTTAVLGGFRVVMKSGGVTDGVK